MQLHMHIDTLKLKGKSTFFYFFRRAIIEEETNIREECQL